MTLPNYAQTNLGFEILTEKHRRELKSFRIDVAIESIKIHERLKINGRNETATITAMDVLDNQELCLTGDSSSGCQLTKFSQSNSSLKSRKRTTIFPTTPVSKIADVQFCPIETRFFVWCAEKSRFALADTTTLKTMKEKIMENAPIQVHWNQFHATNPLLAVANCAPSAQIIDFRAIEGSIYGNNILWNRNNVVSVRWYPSDYNLLYMGDNSGNLSLFDIRNSIKPLIERKISDDVVNTIQVTTESLITIDGKNKMRLMNSSSLETISEYQLEKSRKKRKEVATQAEILDESELYVATAVNNEISIVKFPRNGTFPEEKRLEGCMNDITALKFRQSKMQLLSGASNSSILIWSTDQSSKSRYEEDAFSEDEA